MTSPKLPDDRLPPQSTPIIDGTQLRQRRAALGLTQRELAAWLDITQSTVDRWENRRTEILHPRMLWLALEAIAAILERRA